MSHSMKNATQTCPCGSGHLYKQCCGLYIHGIEAAPTAEALMRSRYSAYVMHAIDYLGETLHPDNRKNWDRQATDTWARKTEWLQLEVRRIQAGGVADQQGRVEFVAFFKDQGVIKQHHEWSSFHRLDGNWYYVGGVYPKPVACPDTGIKAGRNDPCPCGSGKKYKKCCGI